MNILLTLQKQPIIAQQNNSNWRMNRGLADKELHLETLNDDIKVFYGPKSLCLTSQTNVFIGKKPYALSNINDEDATEGEFNSASDSDAFGTDNFATHHI